MDNNIPDSVGQVIGGNRPLILDGGLGSELAARGGDIDTSLWSAGLILSEPGRLLEVHRAYLEAGADCITTASYQASVAAFRQQGLAENEIQAVFAASIRIAQQARDEFMREHPGARRPLIAASIGPYGAYLADGSEYRGNYGLSDRELVEFHAERLYWLDHGDADLLAVETIPDLQEARILAKLLADARTPAWVSFCCRDARYLHDGNRLAAAAALFRDHPRVFALGANCCPSALVEDLIATLRKEIGGKLIVVYPNSGEQYDAATRSWRGDTGLERWSELARSWYLAGARLIGGCCRIGPQHINQLAKISVWRC